MEFLTNINLSKNELQNAVIQPLSSDPSSPKLGQIYYNTTDKVLKQFNGTSWDIVGKGIEPATYTDLGGVIVDSNSLEVVTSGANQGKLSLKSDLKTKLDGIAAGAQVNVIEEIKVNNTTVSPENKVVEITVPESSSDLSDASNILLADGTVSMSGDLDLNNHKITNLTNPSNNQDAATKKYVDDAINGLPEAMIFKGTLGTSGTITTLPAASSSNEGYTYKVITAGTYQTIVAEVGDLLVSTGSEWVLIPSGDEPSGTVTSIKIEANSPIVVNDSSAISTSGTRIISHANSGVTAGAYTKVTVDEKGHVTSGGQLSASDIPDISGTYKKKQTAVEDPSVIGSAVALEFISNITQDTNGVITPTKKGISADNTPTENSSNLVTSGGVYSAIQDLTGGAVTKKSITNPQLTSSGGAWTWIISGSDALGTSDVLVTVYRAASGAVVYPDISINQSTGAITITINDTASAGTLAAGTYKVIIVG